MSVFFERAAISALIFCLTLCVACETEREGLRVSSASVACGSCHSAQYAEWRTSSMSRSAASPVFLAMVSRAGDAWGEEAAEQCRSCHSPGHGEDLSVSCVSCHGAVGNRGVRDGRLIVDLDVPLSGPFGVGEADAHVTRKSGFLKSAELCGSCHEVTGPNIFIEKTHSEFRDSEIASAGVVCVDCHMPRLDDAPAVAGGPVRTHRDHRFTGFDPPWGASEAEALDAAARTRALLVSGLALDVERGGSAQLTIHVTNRGTGHAIPTGVAALRDIWVDVHLIDALGERRLFSERVIELGAQPTKNGRAVVLMTQADDLHDYSLASGARRTATLLDLPRHGRLEVSLYGRAIKEEVLGALDLQALQREAPTHLIAREMIEIASPE